MAKERLASGKARLAMTQADLGLVQMRFQMRGGHFKSKCGVAFLSSENGCPDLDIDQANSNFSQILRSGAKNR